MSQKSNSLLTYIIKRMENNTETLTMPVHLWLEHVGKGIEVWREEGESRDRAKPAPNHAKKPATRGGGVCFLHLSAPN